MLKKVYYDRAILRENSSGLRKKSPDNNVLVSKLLQNSFTHTLENSAGDWHGFSLT
jgi:hypothetical protein